MIPSIVPSGHEAANAELARYLSFVTARHGDSEWIANGRTWRRLPDGRWIARTHAPEPGPSAQEIERSLEVGRLAAAAQAAMPSWDDLRKDRRLGRKLELGDTDENGMREGMLRDLTREDRLRIAAMEAEAMGYEEQISEVRSGSTEFVELHDEAGRARHVPAEQADQVARRDGLRQRLRVKQVTT